MSVGRVIRYGLRCLSASHLPSPPSFRGYCTCSIFVPVVLFSLGLWIWPTFYFQTPSLCSRPSDKTIRSARIRSPTGGIFYDIGAADIVPGITSGYVPVRSGTDLLSLPGQGWTDSKPFCSPRRSPTLQLRRKEEESCENGTEQEMVHLPACHLMSHSVGPGSLVLLVQKKEENVYSGYSHAISLI